MIALKCVYSGRVQGVGFRQSVFDIARGFHITGYVQNLESGEVELLAQGPQGEVERFASKVALELAFHIEQVEQLACEVEERPAFHIK